MSSCGGSYPRGPMRQIACTVGVGASPATVESGPVGCRFHGWQRRRTEPRMEKALSSRRRHLRRAGPPPGPFPPRSLHPPSGFGPPWHGKRLARAGQSRALARTAGLAADQFVSIDGTVEARRRSTCETEGMIPTGSKAAARLRLAKGNETCCSAFIATANPKARFARETLNAA